MDTIPRRSKAASAVRVVSIPALVGASLGAVAALVIPHGDQGEVMSSTPTASSS